MLEVAVLFDHGLRGRNFRLPWRWPFGCTLEVGWSIIHRFPLHNAAHVPIHWCYNSLEILMVGIYDVVKRCGSHGWLVNVYVTGDFPTTISWHWGPLPWVLRTGRSFSFNILCWLEDYIIITSLFSLSFFARYSNPSFHPALPSLSLHHRLRFILHFWRCHSKESIKVSVIIRWINPLEQIQYHYIRL